MAERLIEEWQGCRAAPVKCRKPYTSTFSTRECFIKLTQECKRDGSRTLQAYEQRKWEALARNELHWMSQLQHPNVLSLERPPRSFANHGLVCRVTQRYDCSLADMDVEELSSAEALHGALDSLTKAVAYLHERSLVHRGISPRHVLGTPGEGWWRFMKLCGFKDACQCNSTLAGGTGDGMFAAPEMQQRLSYCEKVDVWGAAATALHASARGKSAAQYRRDLISMGQSQKVAWRPETDSSLIAVVRKMLLVSPNCRITAATASQEISSDLNLKFFRKSRKRSRPDASEDAAELKKTAADRVQGGAPLAPEDVAALDLSDHNRERVQEWMRRYELCCSELCVEMSRAGFAALLLVQAHTECPEVLFRVVN